MKHPRSLWTLTLSSVVEFNAEERGKPFEQPSAISEPNTSCRKAHGEAGPGLLMPKWSDQINDSSGATAALPHRCRAQPVGKRKPWLIWTYGFLIQVKMSEPCCIWCHFSLLKMPHKAVTKGEEMEKNTVITHSRAGFCGSLASGLRD